MAGAPGDDARLRRDGEGVADGQVPAPARSHHDCVRRQRLQPILQQQEPGGARVINLNVVDFSSDEWIMPN